MLSDDPYAVWQTCQVIVSDNPAVAYLHWSDLSADAVNVDYIRATDPDGDAGWAQDLTNNLGGVATTTQNVTSMAMINGKPAIAYCAVAPLPNALELIYVSAQDSSGSSWNTPVAVDQSYSSVGRYPSLAQVGGNPAISYWNGTTGKLAYVRASAANGSTWSSPHYFSSTGIQGLYTSLAMVSGDPAISYYDWTGGHLMYVRATNADGTSWGSAVQPVTSTSNLGEFTSLAVVDNNPAISFYSVTSGDLVYCRAANTTGSSWYSPYTVDSSGNVGLNTSLAVVDGRPAIGYWDYTNSALKYVRAGDADGYMAGSWGTPQPLVSADVAQGASLAVIGGVPAMSYSTISGNDLYYVAASDPDGGSWASPKVVDNTGTTGYSNCLCQIDGGPGIAYLDMNEYRLRYVYGF